MTVTFELKTDPQILDIPLVNLRNKEFDKVIINCIDDVTYTFIEDVDHSISPLDSVLVFGNKVITLYSQHFSFEREGNTYIIPYESVARWKLCP